MPGSSSFGSDSGATKSGITNWSRPRRVSRTRPRNAAVRRKRRSRVTGNELMPDGCRTLRQSGAAVVPARTGRPSAARARSRRRGPSIRPRLERRPARRRTPRPRARRRAAAARRGSREAVDLAAGEQAEDHEQRMQAQRAPHHLRHDDVPLELLDAEEEQRDPERRDRMQDERVQHGRHRAEPRARCTGSTR